MNFKHEYLGGKFCLHIQNKVLDNAQYLMLYYMDKNQKDDKNINEELGLPLGEFKCSGINFRFYISGFPVINRYDGSSISDHAKLAMFLIDEREAELHYSVQSYIQVICLDHPDRFYGVHSSVADAIKQIEEENYIC